MSVTELAKVLNQSLQHSNDLLRELLAALQQHRLAWSSHRQGQCDPGPATARITAALAAAERQREPVLASLAAHLAPASGVIATAYQVNITRIAAALPGPAARQLRETARESSRLAAAVQVEVKLGERLLQFGKQVVDSLLGGAVAEAHPRHNAALYDRRAKATAGGAAVAARLLDGRI